MHTPSETSSTREQLIEAFAFFESTFGSLPRMYVEHSPGNNLDAQKREGANPSSPYYNTDLLNDSQCWVWVVDAVEGGRPTDREAADLLTQEGAPFSRLALPLYGIARGFLRNGFGKANGDSFLEQYTERVIDTIESEGGLVLLYTHLNYEWLDPYTREGREPIRQRLAYLAQKPGWFATGTQVLDRFEAMRSVHLSESEGCLKVVNSGAQDVASVGFQSYSDRELVENGKTLPRSANGCLVIDRLAAFETRTLLIEDGPGG